MLNQELVLVFLQVGITGAGLVLAIYALIIPFTKRVFERNIVDFLDALRIEKNLLKKWLKNEPDKESVEKVQSTAAKILESLTFPTYLRLGVGATFFGYTLTTLASVAWLVDWQKTIMDFILVPCFTLSTLIFLFVGLISIKDIHKIMRQDFNQMIKSLKDDENKTKNEI